MHLNLYASSSVVAKAHFEEAWTELPKISLGVTDSIACLAVFEFRI